MEKKSLWFLRQQNRGAAIVIVIVAMAFVGILGSTLMWMSLMNYRMKATDRQVKESFYDAETVFEQLIVGLQNTASDAADESYSFIMQNYANFSEDKRNVEFQKEYLKGIRDAIAKSETETDQYDLQKLMNYVDKNLNVTVASSDASIFPDNFADSWIGARVAEGKYNSRFGEMISPADADYIVLRGLHLVYVDRDEGQTVGGYVSVIDTDIMIKTPDAGFTQSGSMSDVFDYAIIADKGIEIQKGNGGDINKVTIRGNVYSGENGLIKDIKDTSDTVLEDLTGEGLIINESASLTVEKADYFVSRANVLLKDNSSLTVGKGEAAGDVPECWLSDIQMGEKLEDKTVKQKDKNVKLSLSAHAFVKDDLTLYADASEVKLSGSFYAYGNENGNGENKAANSSAIIVNGEGNTLDFSGLSHLLLAGQGYTSVGIGKLAKDDTETKKVEIPTGESVAVKGSQIAYLVPGECIAVMHGESMVGKNPVRKADYERYEKYIGDPDYEDTFREVDYNRQIPALQNRSLSSYGVNDVKKVFIPSNGETMVYYYLLFSSAEEREQFFADYYGLHKDKLDRYAKLYAGGGIDSPTNYTRITVQGNYLETDPDAGTVDLKRRTDSMSGHDLGTELDTYQSTFESLTTVLSPNYLSMTATQKGKSVYENIIDAQGFREKVIKNGAIDTWKIKSIDGSEKYMAVLANKDTILGTIDIANSNGTTYAYKFVDEEKDGADKVDVVLIISSGDVVVDKDFEGVIIAGGKVVLRNGVTVTSAKEAGKMSELARVLQEHHSGNSAEPRPLDFIQNASHYVLAGTALEKDEETIRDKNIDFANFVKYQNWTKK